jgi:hypothetical protein
MTKEQIAEAGVGLLMEYPQLDVDFIFRLEHSYPPARRLAERLASRSGFWWSEVRVRTLDQRRWRVTRWSPATPDPQTDLAERWRCELWLEGPAGQRTKIQGIAEAGVGLPAPRRAGRERVGCIVVRPASLPAGWTVDSGSKPAWRSALHPQRLIEVEHYLGRYDKP